MSPRPKWRRCPRCGYWRRLVAFKPGSEVCVACERKLRHQLEGGEPVRVRPVGVRIHYNVWDQAKGRYRDRIEAL